MKAAHTAIAAWAGLCLAGLAATSVLTAEPYAQKPDSPYEQATPTPTPAATHTVDCRQIADDIERARAEADRQVREGFSGNITVTTSVVPEECAGVLEDRGLKGD
ncbi:hypothetical protein [Streptomyces sp. NPDC059850]|uniref:hypothetical protein n=1 Tax=Streptomyces sp. NPDC059850 TaxID=3346970 RepID=UPI0036595B75